MTAPPIAWAFSLFGCVVSTHRTEEAAQAHHERLLKSRRYRFTAGPPPQVNIYPLNNEQEALDARREAMRNRGTGRRTS